MTVKRLQRMRNDLNDFVESNQPMTWSDLAICNQMNRLIARYYTQELKKQKSIEETL